MSDAAAICERLERADTAAERMRGLIGRDGLADGAGLLIATNSIHMLFMRFPIDALFLGAPAPDGTRRVVAIRPHLRPWRGVVWYVRGATDVVELPAGSLERHGVQPGDRLVIEPSAAISVDHEGSASTGAIAA
jgi:hypothetical protein